MKSAVKIVKMVRQALADSPDVVGEVGARIYTEHPRIKADAQTGQTDLVFPLVIVDLQGGDSRQRGFIAMPLFHLYAYHATGFEALELIDKVLQAIDGARICSKVSFGFPATGHNSEVDAYFARLSVRMTLR